MVISPVFTAMTKQGLSAAERAKLHEIHQRCPHHRVRIKALVLILKENGASIEQIKKITRMSSKNTVKAYLKQYKQGGIEAISALNFRQATSSLAPFEAKIRTYFENKMPSSIKQICHDIHQLTGVLLQRTAVSDYIKSLGVKFLKTASIPAGAKPEVQREYHDKELQPRIQEARDGKRTLYFMDAAHFVLGAFLSFVWCFSRPLVRTPSGRQRFNVLGAINATSHELLTVTNDAYITATQVCELLRKISKSSDLPITIILDNARYQKCAVVTELATQLKIELLYLPTYSPNLNLIERLWKHLKKTCLNSTYYADFASFKQAIQHFLDSTATLHKEALDSLLTLKFQLFSEEDIRCAA